VEYCARARTAQSGAKQLSAGADLTRHAREHKKESPAVARTLPTKPGNGVVAMTERLWEIYEQLCQVEMRGLDEFIRRLKSGEFGEFPRDDVIAFLREIEATVLTNIQTKAMEHYRYAEMVDAVSDETHQMFDDLIEQYERA
jgi:hypothetical protein